MKNPNEFRKWTLLSFGVYLTESAARSRATATRAQLRYQKVKGVKIKVLRRRVRGGGAWGTVWVVVARQKPELSL